MQTLRIDFALIYGISMFLRCLIACVLPTTHHVCMWLLVYRCGILFRFQNHEGCYLYVSWNCIEILCNTHWKFKDRFSQIQKKKFIYISIVEKSGQTSWFLLEKYFKARVALLFLTINCSIKAEWCVEGYGTGIPNANDFFFCVTLLMHTCFVSSSV